jgi:hypothetical protein
MELILGGINGHYLRNITLRAADLTESVQAAVAYASEGSLLCEWCWDNDIPLKFWGRYDESVPVSIPILRTFLERKSPNFVCKLVKHLHAKVIWWKNVGVYIGSANLSNPAWYRNIEAGCFFDEAEIISMNLEEDLSELFRAIDFNSSPLTLELLALIEARIKELTRLKSEDSESSKRFLNSHIMKQWPGLSQIKTKEANEVKRTAFLKEWWDTLQIIRDIGDRISSDRNRPIWVNPGTPKGAQADQFLHAYYYHRTFDGRRANYEAHFNKNAKNPNAAVNEAIEWWRALINPPSKEDRTLNEWAPFLKEMLSQPKLPSLSSDELVEVCKRVHAIQEHARRVRNHVVGLPGGRPYTMEEKTTAFAEYLYKQTSDAGEPLLSTLAYVLNSEDTQDTPLRLWEGVNNPRWRIDHLGISALGELIGWALPDIFPARNGRTSKALRSLGYDVTVHVE